MLERALTGFSNIQLALNLYNRSLYNQSVCRFLKIIMEYLVYISIGFFIGGMAGFFINKIFNKKHGIVTLISHF